MTTSAVCGSSLVAPTCSITWLRTNTAPSAISRRAASIVTSTRAFLIRRVLIVFARKCGWWSAGHCSRSLVWNAKNPDAAGPGPSATSIMGEIVATSRAGRRHRPSQPRDHGYRRHQAESAALVEQTAAAAATLQEQSTSLATVFATFRLEDRA